MAKFLTINVFLGILLSTGHTITNTCVQKSPCLCMFDEHSKIDIETLHDSGNFLWATKSNWSYFFHGCINAAFDAKQIAPNSTFKANTTLIRYSAPDQNFTNLGDSRDIKFEIDDTNRLLVYKGANGNITATINLICAQFRVPLLIILDPGANELALVSPHACTVTYHPGLSAGSVLLILFCVACAIYFVGGGLILYFLRGARGYEVVPNIDFWRDLPGLVRDGVIFIFSGCNTSFISTAETYDRI